MTTLLDARTWMSAQRYRMGNPRITRVDAYLGDDPQSVSIHAEIENGDAINGGLPLVATYRLCEPLTQDEFDQMRSDIEKLFEDWLLTRHPLA